MGEPIDLSELESLSLSPKWERASVSGYGERGQRPGNRCRERRDSRPSDASPRGAVRGFGFAGGDRRRSGESTGRRFGGGGDRESGRGGAPWRRRRGFSDRRDFRRKFEPIVAVEFYPNDLVFEAVCAALKSTHKTYELFTAARLFLEKPERFAMVLRKSGEQGDKNLYLTVDDNFVFATEGEAIAHVLGVHRGKYFDVEEREVPPPSGNFTCLHKCSMTGKILCPPNYHRYHEIVMNHCDTFLPNVPFERFREKIEKTTDSQEIENWRAASAKLTVLIPKDCDAAGGRIELGSQAEIRRYFMENLRSKTITAYDSVRLSGETFSAMPRNSLSKSIFVAIEREKTFPLNFSNNLRGRLRRSGFTIYKLGGKPGISYISGVRRKFRAPGDIFADDIQRIISCIDANPRISVASLCSKCQQPIGDGARGMDMDATVNDGSDDIAAFDNMDGAEEATGLEMPHNHELLRNLHWLICEGYVAEFENGALVSTGVMQPQGEADDGDDGGEPRETGCR